MCEITKKITFHIARHTRWGLNTLISVPNTLRIFRDHHYYAFDISQNNELNIQNWKSYKVSAKMLAAQNILFEEEYFKDETGNHVYRSAYEFIRDHLGYRLYFDLNKTKISAAGNQVNYDIQFRNIGFSAVVNPRPVYLALIDETGNVAYKQQLTVNPKNWQSFDPALKDYKVLTHQMKGSTTVSGLKGNFKVGLWLPDPTPPLELNAKYTIRFANKGLVIWQDATKRYTVNVLGTVIF